MGVVLNNNLTWSDHLEGEHWRAEDNFPGLIAQLSQRVGLLQKLSYSTSKQKLKMFASSIFYSKLYYCFPLIASLWGLDEYNDKESKSISMTKDHTRKLQVLQNKVCRLLLPRKEQIQCRIQNQSMSTEDLLKSVGEMSIHQYGAFSTIMLAKKIITSGYPKYLANRLETKNNNTRSGNIIPVEKPHYRCQGKALYSVQVYFTTDYRRI